MQTQLNTISATNLRCEALVNPLATGQSNPRLSWLVESDIRGQKQIAYEILAASSPELLEKNQGDLWRSGQVESDETTYIQYEGKALNSAQRCWWKVRVWDKADRVSEWSTPAVFGVGLTQTDWQDEWVGFNQVRNFELPPAPFEGASWLWLDGNSANQNVGVFVGNLRLPDDVIVLNSQLALTVSGRYCFFFGGEQFGMSDGEPDSWRYPYIRHLNERLHPGDNIFLIKAEKYGDLPPALLFKLTVQEQDGRTFTLVSDESWRGTAEVQDDWYNQTNYAQWAECRAVAAYGQEPWGIIYGAENFLPPPAYMRSTFTLAKSVRRATLFATALGWFDLQLNGERVNQSYFDPGWTDYHKRLYYRAYDVTGALTKGENALGVVLADGWYSGYIGWYHRRDTYGKYPRFRGQLHLEFEDGSTQIIGTHSGWKAAIGPIKEADILMGESYDARDELGGWAKADYDDSAWQPVDIGISISPVLEPHPAPAVVALEAEQFAPIAITEPKPGVFIFNLGQNFAGIARLKLRNPAKGQKIKLRFGEMLNADGTLYVRNLRTARATDSYICQGVLEEIWAPRFTFHGFQYVEVTGLRDILPTVEMITGIPLSTDTPLAGTFECSDELANRLSNNVYWSQRSNFIDIPTDCPQRDERLGWGDAAWTFVRAGALRADVQGFYNKWMVDLDDAQYSDGLFPWVAPLVVTKMETSGPLWAGSGPAWADAGIICPWSIYSLYGDKQQLAQHYPAMVRQIVWYVQNSRPDLLPFPNHKCLGDWLNYNAPIPDDVFRTAFFALSTGLVVRAAKVLDKTDDVLRLEKLHQVIKAAFQAAYVLPDGRILGDTQSGYALALLFGLLDENQSIVAAEHLVANIGEHNWQATTGMEATLPLMLTLSRLGRTEVAYHLLHNETFPSWNFSILNGATTIWERWDSWTPENGFGAANMNSFNHFSLGAVYQWMVEYIGGIRKEEPGYKKLVIGPVPGGKLKSARVSYQSIHGLIQTEWKLSGSMLEMEIQIPANTTATLIMPARKLEDITESGISLEQVSDLRIEKQLPAQVYLAVGSGQYHFRIQDPVIAL